MWRVLAAIVAVAAASTLCSSSEGVTPSSSTQPLAGVTAAPPAAVTGPLPVAPARAASEGVPPFEWPSRSLVLAMGERVRSLGGNLTEVEMRAVLELAGWPAELQAAALRVAWGESRWSPYAHNGKDVGQGSYGLFQLNVSPFSAANPQGWASVCGVEPEELFDPVTNATCAWHVYQRSGWGPWSVKP